MTDVAEQTSLWQGDGPPPPPAFTVAGLFAGIGGLELGLEAVGGRSKLLCEYWAPATAVLKERFPEVEVAPDVRSLDALPDVEVVTAGFPCTDLSQAGRTEGISGRQSGLVHHLFRLLEQASPQWVVVENVRNMLVLDNGAAMSYLVRRFERLGYSWAYRLVDSRFTGVPQRRQRVIFVASKETEPQRVLMAEDKLDLDSASLRSDAYGFYWTEGLRGLGWAQDAVPTLKGGSGLGIPSSPAIWLPDRDPGTGIVTPSITHAEQLQGFPADWTKPAEQVDRVTLRWKLVGNAVTVGVARWIGRALTSEPTNSPHAERLSVEDKWPTAAYGSRGRRYRASVSMWPTLEQYNHLTDLVSDDNLKPLSWKATAGFRSRTERSKLRFNDRFVLALREHEAAMA